MLSAQENIAAVPERRVFDRMVARLPVKFYENRDDYSADVYLKDISAGGARLVADRRFAPDEKIDFWVQVPDNKSPLHLKGKVVWAREASLNAWDTGINFAKVRLMDLHRVFSL